MQALGLRAAARPVGCLRSSTLRRTIDVRAFQTARALKAGPIQKAAAATVPSLDDGTFIQGTVNDPTTFPAPSKSHGSYHWTFERLVSAALVPVVGATFVTSPHPVLDGVLGVALVLHSHMGFDSCLVDYLHPRKFPMLGSIMVWVLRGLTLGALYGVYEWNTHDIGVTELVKRLWKA